MLAANAEDVARAEAGGTAAEHRRPAPARRQDRVAGMAQGLREVAGLPDPVGEVVRGSTLANGLELRQVRVPVRRRRDHLRGPPQRHRRRGRHLPEVRQRGAAARQLAAPGRATPRSSRCSATPRRPPGLDADVVQLVPGDGHEAVKELMRARGLVDVLIPRGGAGLIRSVVEESTVPVIETGVGNCHVYVDARGRPRQGAGHRAQRQDPPHQRLQRGRVAARARRRGRRVPAAGGRRAPGGRRHDPRRRQRSRRTTGWSRPPTTTTRSEYLALDISARGRARPRRGDPPHPPLLSSQHTDAIVTEDQRAARRFAAAVDSAAVLVNASTRFTDGGEFGFGAEIGISTQKLHARGPMGLPEMTSTKYVVTGDGHVR